MCDIITLSFVSKRLNKIVHLNSGLKSILNFQIQLFIKKLYEFFMKLIDNLNFSCSFIDCLYFKHRLENLKNEFCIT